jgi:beta-fructofuranosidase
MNDPNGLIQWRGRYHLFYQYNPNGAFWGTIHWGHAVSDDLVHWTDLPIALAPTPGGPDADGCFSGCTVGHNGVPTLIYTGVRGEAQLPCLATSVDDDLRDWQKYPGNPVIAAPPPDVDALIFRDHAVWNEAGTWYQLVGSGIRDSGGAALLYRSEDLIAWEFLHPLYVGDRQRDEPTRTGTEWECPGFFALGGEHVLVVSVMDGALRYVVAFVGDYANQRFSPRTQGAVDEGGHFYAPQVFVDEKGRRIMFGWLREGRTEAAQRAAGWSGVMSLPRVLSVLPDGALGMVAAPELHALRRNHRRFEAIALVPPAGPAFDRVGGDALEIVAEFDPGNAAAFGVEVRRSPNGEEETVIAYDRSSARLVVDARRSSRDEEATGDVRSARHVLAPGEPLRLQVFLDRSVIEVFANGRTCLTDRVYPSRPDSLGVRFFGRGGEARLRSLDVWELAAR